MHAYTCQGACLPVHVCLRPEMTLDIFLCYSLPYIFWAWMSLFCINWLTIENLGSTCLWHPSLGITGWCYCAPTLFGYRERIWTHVFMVAHQELCPLNHLCRPIIECAFIYLFCLFFYLSISEIPSCYVAQAGLEQLDSSHCPVSTTGVVCAAHWLCLPLVFLR